VLALHEAMVEVLRDHGSGWMDRDELAREIARRDLFRRPSDDTPPPSDQLRLRAHRYPHLFECSDTRCTQIRLRGGGGGGKSGHGHLQARTGRGRPASQAARPTSPRVPAARHGRREAEEGSAWYEELREQYRPTRLRVLLIAESPPHAGAGERRFFFSPRLTIDNLYRGVAQALYGEQSDVDVSDKPAVLERIRDDGFWLIDASEQPINKLVGAARARAIAEAVPRLVERCRELAPERGVIICHGKVYAAAAPALREAGVNVLHEEPLPFPLGNWRRQFVAGFRRALAEEASLSAG
jgi:hypothetical protein